MPSRTTEPSSVAVLTSRATLSSPPSIERLRSFTGGPDFAPDLEQLRIVVTGLATVQPLPTIAATSGLSTDDVLQVVDDLGSWLAKSQGGADAQVELDAGKQQLSLPMQFTDPARAPRGRGKKAPAPVPQR